MRVEVGSRINNAGMVMSQELRDLLDEAKAKAKELGKSFSLTLNELSKEYGYKNYSEARNDLAIVS